MCTYSHGISVDHEHNEVVWRIGATALRLDSPHAIEDLADSLKYAANATDTASIPTAETDLPTGLSLTSSGRGGVGLTYEGGAIELTAMDAHDAADDLYDACCQV